MSSALLNHKDDRRSTYSTCWRKNKEQKKPKKLPPNKISYFQLWIPETFYNYLKLNQEIFEDADRYKQGFQSAFTF